MRETDQETGEDLKIRDPKTEMERLDKLKKMGQQDPDAKVLKFKLICFWIKFIAE